MNHSRVLEILESARGKRILVVGDIMLDRYVSGEVERICPEAPVPVVRIRDEHAMLGGCGNVARNLAPFGLRVSIASVVGDDEEGRTVRKLLREDGTATRGLFVDAARPTTSKTRVTAERQQMIRLDREDSAPMSEAVQRQVIDWLAGAIPECAVVLVSDYAKGVLSEPVRKAIFETARAHGVPALVDPKLSDFRAYRGAFLIKPNYREACAAAGARIENREALEKVGRRLRRSTGCDALVITRGPHPTAVFQAGRKVEYVPTLAREVFDVSGAGDTMLALLGVGLAAGGSVVDAVHLANIAAGIVVGKVGTARAEVAEILAQAAADRDPAARKSIDPRRLAPILDEHRAQGRKIVFTNGCFDLLHAGHIRFLQQARRLGNVLIVGLNSDDSVRRVKGPPRPFLGQSERVQIVAALDSVDYVVVFNEPTPRKLLRRLRPDVLVKGREQSSEAVVGADIVKSYGGTVKVLGAFEGTTVTELSREIHASLNQTENQK
jgi:D-beta-D-heptose 7-phosphate kinase/D-beta-D-heptose 1-phosphate adenosyltransferase